MRQIKGLAALAICCGLLSGCATYKVPAGASTAKLVSRMENNSTGTTLRLFWTSISRYTDCSDAARLQTKVYPGDSYTAETAVIEAGRDLAISATYADARFGENRECSITAEFSPVAGKVYLVDMQVRHEVSSCRMNLYDITEGEEKKKRVYYQMPQQACRDQQLRSKNGQPIWTPFRIIFS